MAAALGEGAEGEEFAALLEGPGSPGSPASSAGAGPPAKARCTGPGRNEPVRRIERRTAKKKGSVCGNRRIVELLASGPRPACIARSSGRSGENVLYPSCACTKEVLPQIPCPRPRAPPVLLRDRIGRSGRGGES